MWFLSYMRNEKSRLKQLVICKLPPQKIIQSNTNNDGKRKIAVFSMEKKVKSNSFPVNNLDYSVIQLPFLPNETVIWISLILNEALISIFSIFTAGWVRIFHWTRTRIPGLPNVQFVKWTSPKATVYQSTPLCRFSHPHRSQVKDHYSSAQTVKKRKMQWKEKGRLSPLSPYNPGDI